MERVKDNNSPVWINVKTSEGMFSSEKAVTIKLANGEDVSLFADKELLKEEDGIWKLKVSPVSTNCVTQLVLLPVEPFEVPTRWVEVPL